VTQYNRRFYMHYLVKWPEYNVVAESLDGRPIGYSKFLGIHQSVAVPKSNV